MLACVIFYNQCSENIKQENMNMHAIYILLHRVNILLAYSAFYKVGCFAKSAGKVDRRHIIQAGFERSVTGR